MTKTKSTTKSAPASTARIASLEDRALALEARVDALAAIARRLLGGSSEKRSSER
jgi:hypothetical protein